MTVYKYIMLSTVAAAAIVLLKNVAVMATTDGTLLARSEMGNVEDNRDLATDPKQMCAFPSMWKTRKCKKYFKQEAEASRLFSRIIGGSKVNTGTYPWFARAIQNNKWIGCGGSLVSPEWVLTAAHCTQGWKPIDKYQIGSLCPKKSNNCGQNMVTVDVDKVYNHPKYNEDSMVNDFSLVKLKSRVTGISPVKMDMGDVVDSYSDDHKGLYAIGFGDQNPNSGERYAKQLMHVELGYMPTNVCNQYYSGNEIKGSMMCAADPNQDSCQGDSGGPLYDANAGIKTLVGVVSWGYGCADPDYPGVYAKISNKWMWIKNTICQNHSNPRPDFCSDNSPPTLEPSSSPLPEPSSSPITQPTNPAPSGDNPSNCGEKQSEVEVTIHLDKFPSETSWKIIDSSGIVKLEGKNYDEITTVIEKTCLNNAIGYTFTINDSYGDGILGGSYLLKWDGEQIVDETGDFGTSKSHTFGNQVDGGCGWRNGERMKEFNLKFKTDDNGRETYYEIKRGKKVVHDGGLDKYFESNTFYQDSLCLPDACYKLYFYDEFGDGICCNYNKGYYLLNYDGKKVRYSKFKKGYKQVTKFGTCS